MRTNPLIVKWCFMPYEVRDPVRRILVEYLYLLPQWCEVLSVAWWPQHTKGHEVPGSSDANPPYRFAELNVFGSWLHDTERARRHTIVHELLHATLAPIVRCHTDDLKLLLSDSEAPMLKSKLMATFNDAYEGTIQDLTFAILRLDTPSGMERSVAFVDEENEPPMPPLRLEQDVRNPNLPS